MPRSITSAVVVLILASPCLAILDPDENSIGMYFDLDANIHEHWTSEPFETVSCYLAITNPSSFNIGGWECMVDVSGVFENPNWYISAGGLNMLDATQGLFAVGYCCHGPFPMNGVIILAVWNGTIPSTEDSVCFSIHPLPEPLYFDDTPGYVDGDDLGILVPLGPSTGLPYGTCTASINAIAPVENGHATWSGVKSLFR